MKKINYIIYFFLLAGIFSACTKDFLDINQNPNEPLDAPLNQLLTDAQVAYADGYYYNGGICNIVSVYTHQIVTRETWDQYGVNGNMTQLQNTWNAFYEVLPNLDLIISKGKESENLIYVGIAKIMKAYMFTTAVDLWGSLPFSEANRLDEDFELYKAPKFDSGVEIYNACFTLLNEAIADLQNTTAENSKKPGADDLIYGGDPQVWVRAANTIKLKLYNTVRKHSMFNLTEVTKLINDDNLIKAGEDFEFWYNSSSAPDNRHYLFVSEYEGQQTSEYISPWFYEILRGENPNILTGIIDPRIPYYFSNQLVPNETPQSPADYWRPETGFLSIRFGGIGPNTDGDQRSSATMIGIYPCGGWYDDGSGAFLNVSKGTGQAPIQFISYKDLLYIKAELAADQNVNAGTERALLESAILASFAKVDDVVAGSGTSQSVPKLTGSQATTDYVTAVLTQFDAADANKKLEIILTQKWIASFGNPLEQYSDYRRTGYPVPFDPNTDNSNETQSTRDYAVSMPYDANELSLNPKAPKQKTISTDKVFWDVN